MFCTFWLVGQVVLFLLGCWWCKEVFGRFKTDIEEVKQPKLPGQRWTVIFYWALTGCIMLAMGYFVYGIAAPIIGIM